MSSKSYSPGLEGVIAGETAISTVADQGLTYRGYPVGELIEKTSFDEVAYLLLYGDLPTESELKGFQSRVAMARRLPEPLHPLFAGLPKWTPPLDVVRTAVSILGHFDQDRLDQSREANLRKAERLLGQIPVVIADFHRISQGLQPVMARQELSHSANFLYMLRGTEPTAEEVRWVDLSMILYAEHEFNASTFTARVIVSTQSSLHAGITGAIGALKGPLHGGANERVVEVLEAIGTPDKAEPWVRDALAKKQRIMGFGHRIYKSGDVRAGLLKPYVRAAAERRGGIYLDREVIADKVEEIMAREKSMHPNVDWPAGRLYSALDLAIPLYTPMFAMARVAGWSAHIMEQLENNRLIRPGAIYNGPAPRAVRPINERSRS